MLCLTFQKIELENSTGTNPFAHSDLKISKTKEEAVSDDKLQKKIIIFRN